VESISYFFNLLDGFTWVGFAEINYLDTDMCKFESSQKRKQNQVGWVGEFDFIIAFFHTFRPVTRGGAGGESPLYLFAPLEKCVEDSLKILDIVWKIWAPLRKVFAPPGVPIWLQACIHIILYVCLCRIWHNLNVFRELEDLHLEKIKYFSSLSWLYELFEKQLRTTHTEKYLLLFEIYLFKSNLLYKCNEQRITF